MAKAIKKSAASAVVTKSSTVAKAAPVKVVQTAMERFTQSIAKVKTTGDVKADQIATAVVTKIFKRELAMAGDVEKGFTGKIGKTEVKLSKVPMGKSKRYILTVGPVEIGGAFAAKAYTYATTQNKPQAAKKTFDQESLDSVLELLG